MKSAEKKVKSGFWMRVAELQHRAVRKRHGVNLSRLTRLTKANQSVVVADRVLGTGVLLHPLTIAALGFSGSARKGIEKAGGKAMAIAEMKAINPTGKDLTVMI